ncbi:MAG TPA: UDP-N-acetylmuramoyl-L-alanine--D-glutamate ligase [Firmicutes bacterium]|nr:UDP-N-acetylmuramoyl-L-alanine--D-glutamate ligase [Bacillota bacterium]
MFALKKNVAVLGLGIENLALTNYLINRGEKVTVCDNRTPDQLGERYYVLNNLGVEFRLGPGYLERLEDFTVVYRSPGLPLFQPELVKAKANGVKVTSAMRLFVELCPCPLIGVTGTKGKGTTSTLIFRILEKSQRQKGAQVYLGGNIGVAPFTFLPLLSSNDLVVLELSSFQLEDMPESVDIAVITNITEDHLAAADPLNPNYHKSREEYVRAKTNIFRYQSYSGVTIMNHDDPTCRELLTLVRGNLLLYGSANQQQGAWYEKQADGKYTIYWNPAGSCEELIKSDRIKLRGEHNLLNISAAALASYTAGADRGAIIQATTEYTGLEHRLEYVATIDGVQYFDDSFATSPDPTIVALHAFKEPIILIAGGADKGTDYTGLAKEILQSSVKAVVLIGKMGPVIREAIMNAANDGENLPLMVDGGNDMPTIVARARTYAKPGDVVILSTACASFDLFKNYKERGNLFKQQILAMLNNKE